MLLSLEAEIVKVEERSVACCGCGHEKVRGFGHMWIVDSTAEIGKENDDSARERMRTGRNMFLVHTFGGVRDSFCVLSNVTRIEVKHLKIK